MIDAHGGPLVDGQCGVTWGVMAPADGSPGQLHVCRVPVLPLLPGQSADDVKHDRHNGVHWCACGERAERYDAATHVLCEHPTADSVGVCGAAVTGTELVDYRGPRRPGRDQMRAQTILSVPCGHPTQRQAS